MILSLEISQLFHYIKLVLSELSWKMPPRNHKERDFAIVHILQLTFRGCWSGATIKYILMFSDLVLIFLQV